MCASRFQFSQSQLPLPIQNSRWRACPFAHSFCSSVCFAPCVTVPKSVYTPLSFFWSIIWDLFSLCSRCYSQNAKSEIEEVTHVICLAMVCLDHALSAMKKAYTRSFLSHKTKKSNSREAFLFQCLHADSSHCTVAVLFNVFMYICKCIIINIIVVLEPVSLVLVTDRLVLLANKVLAQFISHLLMISKIFSPFVYFAPVTRTEQQYLFWGQSQNLCFFCLWFMKD